MLYSCSLVQALLFGKWPQLLPTAALVAYQPESFLSCPDVGRQLAPAYNITPGSLFKEQRQEKEIIL